MRGSIRERSKNHWQIRIYLGKDKEGKQKIFTESIEGGKRDAERRKTELLHEHNISGLKQPPKQTLSEYLQDWKESSLKGTVSHRTFADYSEIIKRYIDDSIGDIKLIKLEPIHLQNLYRQLADRGLSGRSVKYVHLVLRRALKQAVRWGLVLRNITDLVDLPKHKRKKVDRALDFEQTEKFLKAAKHDTYYPLWVLALESGMRPEEYLALTWSNVDFEKREIKVDRVVCRYRDGTGGYYFADCKTPESHRSIIIAPTTIELLKEWKIKQEAWIKSADKKWNNLNLVFTGKRGDPVHHSNLSKRHFKPLLKAAGLPHTVRLYDLRHTCATIMGASGHRVKEVQVRLGHASPSTTLNVYSHVLESERERPANTFEKFFLKPLAQTVEGAAKVTKKKRIRK